MLLLARRLPLAGQQAPRSRPQGTWLWNGRRRQSRLEGDLGAPEHPQPWDSRERSSRQDAERLPQENSSLLAKSW